VTVTPDREVLSPKAEGINDRGYRLWAMKPVIRVDDEAGMDNLVNDPASWPVLVELRLDLKRDSERLELSGAQRIPMLPELIVAASVKQPP
jgi:hypothetical protein